VDIYSHFYEADIITVVVNYIIVSQYSILVIIKHIFATCKVSVYDIMSC